MKHICACCLLALFGLGASAVAEDAYLFSYFSNKKSGGRRGEAAGLHLACSYDGKTWTALNNDEPLLVPEVIRVLLCAVKRNMAFVDGFLEKGGFLEDRDMELLATIRRLYAQQKEMFGEKKQRVEERIVSVTQPYVRPIVRGKVKDPVEFGAKYDVSVDERGHARLEYVDFEPYNECTILHDVVNRYKERTGH